MNINFELYKVFYYVAKELSFSSAAVQLYISQSAVSQSIKALEERLNCQLFLRSSKNIKLTPEGELLFKHIEQAFHFIKSGEKSIGELHSLSRGEIKIAASDTICRYYLLPVFKKFNTLYPQIKIKITNRTSPICIDLLTKGIVDVSVVNLPEQTNDKRTAVQKVKLLQDVFVASRSYQALKDKPLALKDLEDYPLLVLEKNTVTRKFFDNLMTVNKVNIQPDIELGSIDLLIDLAKINLGIAFATQQYIEKELQNGELFILNMQEEIPPRYLGIMTNTHIPTAPAAQKFIELL